MDGSSELQYIHTGHGHKLQGRYLFFNEFTKDGNHNIINYSVMFTNGYVGTIEGGKNLSDDSFLHSSRLSGGSTHK